MWARRDMAPFAQHVFAYFNFYCGVDVPKPDLVLLNLTASINRFDANSKTLTERVPGLLCDGKGFAMTSTQIPVGMTLMVAQGLVAQLCNPGLYEIVETKSQRDALKGDAQTNQRP
jgi:hypothetical protein